MDILSGLTRPSRSRKPVKNPPGHSPLGFQNRVRVQVVSPDGKVKEDKTAYGNIMATYGLSRLGSLLATGGEASNWVSAGAIGTSTTAAASTQSSLIASTAIVHMSQASMDASDQGARTARYLMTFASNNPAGTAQINEIGLFATNAASGSMVARSVLGASLNYGLAA